VAGIFALRDVGFGSIATEMGYPRDIRFPPNSYRNIVPQHLRQSAGFIQPQGSPGASVLGTRRQI